MGAAGAQGPAATYLRTADHAEGGPQLPTVFFEGQLSMAKQQVANRPRIQGHFCKTTGLVSLKSQRPEWGNRTAAQPLNAVRTTIDSLRGHAAGASAALCLSFLPLGEGAACSSQDLGPSTRG